MLRFLGSALLVASAASSGQEAHLRFHHVHYQVADPGEVMNETATKLGGTRVVASGLGVGVRVGDEFVLFDGLTENDTLKPVPAAAAYDGAIAWLKGKGLTVSPASLLSTRVGAQGAGLFHHLAFAAADIEAVTARLGVRPVRRTSESVFFDAGGQLVEIVREDDGPDTFWCPMHPDVRSGRPGQCPLCRMELVAMRPPKVGEYRLDVELHPASRGATRIRLGVREPDSNALVSRFTTVHEKLFHLFIVSRDLSYFAHVHPEQTQDGPFELVHPLAPGEYMLIADFLPEGATTQMIQRAVIIGSSRGRLPPAPPAVPRGLRVTMSAENLIAGKEGSLVFTVTDAKTGAPVTDLEPYLGAPAHMLIVRSDLTDAVHDHPHEHITGGPTVSFHPLIPAPGDYKLWIQFQRGGTVFTFPFGFRAER